MHLTREEVCGQLGFEAGDWNHPMKAAEFLAFCAMMDAYAVQVEPDFLQSPLVSALFFQGLYDKPDYVELIRRLDPDYFHLDSQCRHCYNGFADKYFRLTILEQLAVEFGGEEKSRPFQSSGWLSKRLQTSAIYVFSDALLEFPAWNFLNLLATESKQSLHILLSQIEAVREALLDADYERADSKGF